MMRCERWKRLLIRSRSGKASDIRLSGLVGAKSTISGYQAKNSSVLTS